MMHEDACSNWNIERVDHAFHRNTAMQIWQFQSLITNSPTSSDSTIITKVYNNFNFRARGISRGARKLARTPTLN